MPFQSPPFRKILVANRGEIAHRLFRACRELGATSVAVYSEADAHAPWTHAAGEAYLLTGRTAAETYLSQTAILDVARACGADAIHPGYGFLSENADFAAACAAAGIVFIGPSPEAIRVMGSKAQARELALQAGVPVIPGVDGAGLNDDALQAAAASIGFPLLIKASAGGGGKGMRAVLHPAELPAALQATRAEAMSAFGDDHLLLEKYFPVVHHVEIQLLGDQHGHLLQLFERDCSVQRRHQKLIEESPSPNVTPELRQALAQAAVSLARAVGYSSAGTVEFVVAPAGQFYLLEMNTRLQVEHPVTELVAGVDLATWQIRIAAGEPLRLRQEALLQRGHALECRVYAEDPARNFLPSIGSIALYSRPSGPGVRVDDGIATGAHVSPYYDPLLAKVITWGADRPEAIARMVQALRETIILGVTTNVPYLLDVLAHPTFTAGRATTAFVEDHMAGWQPSAAPDDEGWLAAGVMEALFAADHRSARPPGDGPPANHDPWQEPTGWRNV